MVSVVPNIKHVGLARSLFFASFGIHISEELKIETAQKGET
jgi:hypothetical protein